VDGDCLWAIQRSGQTTVAISLTDLVQINATQISTTTTRITNARTVDWFPTLEGSTQITSISLDFSTMAVVTMGITQSAQVDLLSISALKEQIVLIVDGASILQRDLA